MKEKKVEERAAAPSGEKPAPAKTEKPEKQPEEKRKPSPALLGEREAFPCPARYPLPAVPAFLGGKIKYSKRYSIHLTRLPLCTLPSQFSPLYNVCLFYIFIIFLGNIEPYPIFQKCRISFHTFHISDVDEKALVDAEKSIWLQLLLHTVQLVIFIIFFRLFPHNKKQDFV